MSKSAPTITSAAAPADGDLEDLAQPTAVPVGPRFLASPGTAEPSCSPANQMSTSPVDAVCLSVRRLAKCYRKANVEIPVLKGVDLDVRGGEFLAIVGQSGSGKSTLLHLIGQLDQPDAGAIFLGDQRIDRLPVRARDVLRNRTFGLVFQFYHLLPELTLLENVLMPVMIRESVWRFWRQRREHHRRAEELLQMMGLSQRLKHRPHELSGGELQRAAIARALINQPRILLADEPTGNLDPTTGEEILSILKTLNREQGLTIVMVTHDQSIAAQAHRIVCLAHGKIRDGGPN